MSAAPADFGRIYRRKRKGKKRSPGWYIRVRRDDKEVTLVGGPTYKAARKKLLEWQQEYDRKKRSQEGDPGEILFEEFTERFLQTAEGRFAPSTLKDMKNKICNLIVPAFKGRIVREIAKRDIVDFLDQRPADLSPATRNRELSALSTLFTKAVELGFATTNPAHGIKRHDEGLKPVPFVSPEGQERLVAVCPEVIRPFVRLVLETGLRKSEALALEWRDVQLERDVLLVRESKSGRPREIPLTTVARALLVQLAATNASGKPAPGTKVVNWLGKGWNRHHDRKLKEAVKSAGFSDITLHSLRHLYASGLAQAGVPIPVIGTLLGHAPNTLRVTMRYARHAPDDAATRAVDQLQKWKNGKLPDEVKETEFKRRSMARPRVPRRVPLRVPRERVRRRPVTS